MSGGNLTRIQNNQITDSTIQGQAKIAAGSITGNLLASSVTFNSNITILGNLTVSNSYTQLNSINTYINDPIVVFNNGYSGSLTNYDIGILVNRNLATLGAYGSVNTFLGWSESASAFVALATTETGTSVSSINNSGYANIVAGNASLVTSTVTNGLIAGSVTSPLATLTTLNSTSGNVITLVATNFSTANAVITGGSISNDVITSSTGAFTTLQGTNFSTGNAVISGGYISALANAHITDSTLTTLVATNFSTANAVIAGGSVNNTPIGPSTASTGAFTTLTASGVATMNANLVAASGTSSSGTNNGALVVVGGTGISGALNTGGIATFSSATPTTGSGTGALQVTNGGAYIAGNLWVGGNINFTPNSVSSISGNSATFYGNAAGFGALYAGISSGYTVQPQTVLQVSSNFNGYAQVNSQNINGGSNASTDFVATADTGNTSQGYIDMGINSSGFVGGAGNELNYPLDGYLYVDGTTSTNGNLLISTSQQADVVFAVNGQGSANEVGRFQYNGGSPRLLLKTTTAATSTTTGALTVAGGAGIAGAVYAGSIQATPIGSTTASTGAFTTLSSTTQATLATAVATNFSTGNAQVTGGTLSGMTAGNFTTLQGTNFSSGNAQITGGSLSGITALNVTTETATNFASGNAVITGGSVNSTPIGASTASTGAFTTLTASSTTILNSNVVAAATTASTNTTTGALVVTGGAGIGGDLNVGGNLKVSGTLTYINTTTELVGGIEIVAGNLVANSGTASSSTTTGALVVTGGAGISGAMNLGGTLVAGAISNTPISGSTGAFTTEVATNFSTGNAVISGGYISALANATVTTAVVTNFSTGNAQIANGSGAFTSLQGTTTQATNFSTGNAQITGGAISNTPISGSTGAFTTEVATNFSTGNAVISGGYISALANATVTTAVVTNFSSGNAVITGGSITGDTSGSFTTLQATNFSTGNTYTTGGRIDGTTVGAFTPSTGAFTTLSAGLATALTSTLTVGGVSTMNGNLVAASGTGSVSTTTGALVVTGGMGVTGNINIGNTSALHSITGNLLVGVGTAAASALTTLEVNQNVDAPQNSTSVLHISAKSGVPGKLTLDSFASGNVSIGSVFIARTSAGTSTTPTAAQSGQIVGAFIARGYGATGYAIAPNPSVGAGMSLTAYDNFTDSVQGTTLALNYIPSGNLLAKPGLTIQSAGGNVGITSTTVSTDANSGALTVAGGVGITGNINTNGNVNILGVTKHLGNVVIASGTNSTSTTTGGLVLAGPAGAGIGGNLNVGGNAYVTGVTYLGATSSAIGLTSPILVGTNNVNNTTQIVIQNTSNGNSASTDFVATANDGTDTTHYIDMGINGSGFNGPLNGWTISGANDGYMYVDSGNLTVGTDTIGTTVSIHTGGTFANNIVATFNANNVQPTSSTTGTMVVTGGVGISGNLNIGNAAAFNSTKTAGQDFVVSGVNDTTLIWARPNSSYDQVIIGNSATASTIVRGAKLQINSTDSFLMPVGTNAQRPGNSGGTDTTGMLRYNTTVGGMEVYTGSAWQAFSTSFTVIADAQFTGTGSQTIFTLPTAQTTASCVVSINGVLQIPTLAYSVSGTTLTFTEAPQSTDIIDIRMLTTTATVTSIASTNGYMSFATDNYGANVYVGTGSSTLAVSYNPQGAAVSYTPNVSVASANTVTTIDTIDNTQYRSAKYVIQVTHGASYQIQEMLVVSDGTTATSVTYGTLQTNGNLGVVQATQSGTNTLIQFIAANATNNVRVKKDYLAV